MLGLASRAWELAASVLQAASFIAMRQRAGLRKQGSAILASVRACCSCYLLQHRYSTRSYIITRIAAALVA